MNNDVIVVVGGSSGIGLATSQYLHKEKYITIVSSRKLVNSRINKTEYHKNIDVLKEESVKNCIESIGKRFNRINGLVYSVGISVEPKSIKDFDKEIWDRVLNTNVVGMLYCCKYAFPFLRKSRGRVVVVGSVAARISTQLSGYEYTISKSAISGLVKQLAIDWAPYNVMINSVHPGMTSTPMLKNNVSISIRKEIEKKIPLGRIADPLEIAKAIEFLVSRKNTYITGSGIDINGGLFLNG